MTSERNNLEGKVKTLSLSLEEQKDFNTKTLAKLDANTKELHANQAKLQEKSLVCDKQRVMLDKLRSENLVFSRQIAKNEAEIANNLQLLRETESVVKELKSEDKVRVLKLMCKVLKLVLITG